MDTLNLSSDKYDDNKKDAAFLQTFDSLPMGNKFIVKSDNDLNSLYSQLEETRMNVFEWEYLKEGPEEWEAIVSKRPYNFF